jgi:long-subunit acyl-CoA synthetase (AMP-forming)
VLDSYGATEAPGIATNGKVSDNFELKLADVESQEYFASSGYGEILVRDKNKYATRSYWQNPEASAAAWDADGWYHTGDIGHLDPKTGRLEIVDRKSAFVELYVEGRSAYVSAARMEEAILGQSAKVNARHLS